MSMQMSAIATALILSGYGIPSMAGESPRRVPVQVDYTNLINHSDASFRSCTALLTSAPRPDRCSVLLMRTAPPDSTGKAIIESISFAPKSNISLGPKTESVTGYSMSYVPPEILADKVNAEALTGGILGRMTAPKVVAVNSTIIVLRGSALDASLVTTNAQSGQFVVEQVSAPRRFGVNMSAMRERRSSQQLTIFDFTPSTEDALAAMKLQPEIGIWNKFSTQARLAVETAARGQTSLAPRTLEALRARLADATGGVVVIYAHSDGQALYLDTEGGVQRLTRSDIEDIGRKSGGRLPPILLLNCNTRSEIAPAFLDAGSPLVMSSDSQLPVDKAAQFLGRLSKRVFEEHQDVIDAFFDIQKSVRLVGMRAIASALSNDSISEIRGVSICIGNGNKPWRQDAEERLPRRDQSG
jgi:hypothetical protein